MKQEYLGHIHKDLKSVTEQYVPDIEYKTYYEELSGLRSKIANDLPIKPGMDILDVGADYGYFAIEVARCYGHLNIRGFDISKRSVRNARRNVKEYGLENLVEILEMDATRWVFVGEERQYPGN